MAPPAPMVMALVPHSDASAVRALSSDGLSNGNWIAGESAKFANSTVQSTGRAVVDGVGEVLKLGADSREAVPINLDPRFRDLATCVHRLDGRLLVILDVDAVLAFTASGHGAAAA